jgi:hypothetical protein
MEFSLVYVQIFNHRRCIQFFFTVLGYAAYLSCNISSYKQQVESGFMFLMQDRGPDSPILQLDPLIRMNSLPHIFLRLSNSSAVSKFFIDFMNFLWPNGIQYERVLLFVTDAASYTIKASTAL